MMIKIFTFVVLLLMSANSFAEEKLTVFAAASLTNALSEVDAQFEKVTGIKVVHSFASSSGI